MARGFAAAFCQGDPRATAFLQQARSPDSFQTAKSGVSASLRAELERQQSTFAPTAARSRALTKLAHDQVRFVVTGQQLGLFLGPLYTVYKALTAVELARDLEARWGTPVLPIFWLQTEDHDFEEVSSYQTLDSTLSVQSEQADRISIAHRTLGPGIDDALSALRTSLSNLPNADVEYDRYAQHYVRGRSWVDAFSSVLASCFGDEELLIFNPRCRTLADAAVFLHRRAIEHSEGVADTLLRRSTELERAGFDVQVGIRPDCTLSFFHPAGPEGPRYRLRPDGDSMGVAGGSDRFNRRTVLSYLEEDPLRFSTSALLRPLVQDALFPTAAYVAGPGELSYFAQLGPLYDYFGIQMPAIVPRWHFTIIEPEVRRILEQLDIDVEGLYEGPLRDQFSAELVVDAQALREELVAALNAILDRTQRAVDADIERPLARTRKTIAFAAERFASRVADAQLRNSDVLRRRIDVLERRVAPSGKRQERVFGFAHFCARFGLDELKAALRTAPKTTPGEFTVVEPQPIPTGGLL